jgi:lysophospholipase L1-like esterase
MKRVLAVFFVLSVATAAIAESGFKLKSGDRVLFYGDSITEQHLYTNFVETFVVTRFPNLNVRFRNTGVGGDTVRGGWAGPIDLRLTRDFLPYKPTVATIMLGMNDGSYRPFDQGIFDNFAKGYASIVAEIKQKLPGCRIMPILPSPYDDFAHKPNWDPGYNDVLVRFGQYLKDLAAKNGLETIDLNSGVVAGLKKAVAIDPKTAAKLMPDRVHPTPQCQLLMAAEILKAWGAPATVTDVSIDIAARKVGKASFTKVTLGDGMSWTQLDERLPFPLSMDDPLVALAMQSSDFLDKLNREMLSVTGLTGAKYALKIDGKTVGEFSPSELEAGVNLTVLKTPMVDQASTVKRLTDMHNQIFMARWRNVQIPFKSEPGVYNAEPGMSKAMAGMEALEDDAVRAQHEAAKPASHTYELVAR